MLGVFFHTILVFAAAATLSLSPQVKTITVGSEFDININLATNGKETLGTDVVITYEPVFLEAVKITPGTLYPNYPPGGQRIDQVAGKVYLSGAANFGAPVSESGLFGTIIFKGRVPGKTAISFDWEEGSTTKTSIVPYVGYANLLKAPPEGLTLSIKEKSLWDKFLDLLKNFLERFAFP